MKEFSPEKFKVSSAGRRTVDWYRHRGVDAWGDPLTDYVDRFAVAHPVDGSVEKRPLLVVLHWRGGGWPGKGVDMQTLLVDGKDAVYAAPDDFHVLVLDDIRDYNVLLNRKHDQYWWGATSAYGGPTLQDVPRLRGRVTACEYRVMASVKWTIERYDIDRNRVYLCGNSMGGQAAYAIGLAHGDVFAAVNANVPATVWYAAARLEFVNDDGSDSEIFKVPSFSEPPYCVEWSGTNDIWSRDREVIVRNLRKRKWPQMVLWGDYGHCGFISEARKKNDLVERFDWLAIRKNEAYPVFTNASCDDKLPWPFKVWRPHYGWFGAWTDDIVRAEMEIAEGALSVGQINAFFRWRNITDNDRELVLELRLATAEELETKHFSPPSMATADVTIRRIQSPAIASANKVQWRYGSLSGEAVRDEYDALTINVLPITDEPKELHISL